MRALSKGSRIEINNMGDTQGEWDRPRMGQVFSNLIGNALQYSHGDSTIDVTIADQGERVLFSGSQRRRSYPSRQAENDLPLPDARYRGGSGELARQASAWGYLSPTRSLPRTAEPFQSTPPTPLARHLPHSCLSGEAVVSGGTPHKEPNPWQGLNHPHRPAEQPSQGAGWIEWPFSARRRYLRLLLGNTD